MKDKYCNIFRKNAYKIFLFIGLHQDGYLTSQTQIAREFAFPVTTVNYNITKFKQEGLLDKHLKLTDKGIKAFKFLWENVNKNVLRAHNIQIVFQVIKCPADFPECFSRKIYTLLSNKRYKGIKTQINGLTVMFYSPKKIVCVLPDIYADSDAEISSAVQVLIPTIKELLEYEFSEIKIGEYELAKIQTMHIAILNSVIAKTYLLKGFTKENKDYAIDNSHGIPEIELTNPSNALRDIMDLLNLEHMFQRDLLVKEDIKENDKKSK